MKFLLLLALACGSNDVYTWRDASAEYAAVWCAYAERCLPDTFARYDPACAGKVTDELCGTGRVYCGDVYPHDRTLITGCLEQFEALTCSDTELPAICRDAY